MFKYLKVTKHTKLALRVDYLSVFKWWIDTYYTTHGYFRVHAGIMMSLGRVAVLSSSLKQKLNVNSSTEGVIVGAYNGLIVVLWSKRFIGYQGFMADHNILSRKQGQHTYGEKWESIKLKNNKAYKSTAFF